MAINKLLKLIRFKRLMQIVRIKVTSIIMGMLLVIQNSMNLKKTTYEARI